MNESRIISNQNVVLNQQLANLWQRGAGFIIDTFLFLFLGLTLGAVGAFSSQVLVIGISLLYWLYDLIMEYFFNGQTVGKIIMKTQVRKLDGSEAGFFNYFLRWLLRPIDGLPSYSVVQLISAVVTENNQRLGDLAAGTTVFSLKTDKNFVLKTKRYKVNPDYQITYKGVENLIDKDIQIIKDVLEYHRNIGNEKSVEVVQKTRKAIETKIQEESNKQTIDFLKTIIKDYNAFSIMLDEQELD